MKENIFEIHKDVVYGWRDICELHWERMLGEFWGDEQFWDQLFHQMEAQDWEAVVSVAKAMQISHTNEIRPFPNFSYNIEVVEKRLHKCDPVIKKYNRQGYNKAAVSLFMAVRDVLNEINGTPTKRWTDKEREKALLDRKVTTFEQLFERK